MGVGLFIAMREHTGVTHAGTTVTVAEVAGPAQDPYVGVMPEYVVVDPGETAQVDDVDAQPAAPQLIDVGVGPGEQLLNDKTEEVVVGGLIVEGVAIKAHEGGSTLTTADTTGLGGLAGLGPNSLQVLCDAKL